MGRPYEAAKLLKHGCSPREIAKEMGVTLSTIMDYLYREAGAGHIGLSEIVFSIPRRTRQEVEALISEIGSTHWHDIFRVAKERAKPVHRDDLQVYLQLRETGAVLGDLYQMVRDIETVLHAAIRKVLQRAYGEQWLQKGVPQKVRDGCERNRRKDPEPLEDLFRYTTLKHLKDILEAEWQLCEEALPKELAPNKDSLLSSLDRLYRIRNAVMHPAKAVSFTDEDFAFVRDLKGRLDLRRWKLAR